VEASVTMESAVESGDYSAPALREAQLVLRHLLDETWKCQKQTINGKSKP